MRTESLRRLWLAPAGLALLSPLGLLASSTAWGEWSGAELRRRGLGFVPNGLARLSGLWRAPMAGYGLRGMDTAPGYLLSALLGAVVIAGAAWLLGRALVREERDGSA